MLTPLSLLNCRLQDIAILIHEVKYGLAPSAVDELFRNKSTLVIHLETVILTVLLLTFNCRKHSQIYQGLHSWSKVDKISLRGASNIESFKKNIRKKT